MGRGTFQQVTQQLGPRWTPTRRFGIAQGNKTRPRDDFTESLVIRAISCTWKGTVDGGDRTAAVVELWTRVLQLDDVQVAFASCQVLEALSSLGLQGRERGAWASASTSRWHVSTALAGKDRDVGVSAIVDPARRAELHSPTLAVGSKVEFNRVETAQMMVKAPFLLGVDHRDDFPIIIPDNFDVIVDVAVKSTGDGVRLEGEKRRGGSRLRRHVQGAGRNVQPV